jgi:hypothetical protein
VATAFTSGLVSVGIDSRSVELSRSRRRSASVILSPFLSVEVDHGLVGQQPANCGRSRSCSTADADRISWAARIIGRLNKPGLARLTHNPQLQRRQAVERGLGYPSPA